MYVRLFACDCIYYMRACACVYACVRSPFVNVCLHICNTPLTASETSEYFRGKKFSLPYFPPSSSSPFLSFHFLPVWRLYLSPLIIVPFLSCLFHPFALLSSPLPSLLCLYPLSEVSITDATLTLSTLVKKAQRAHRAVLSAAASLHALSPL